METRIFDYVCALCGATFRESVWNVTTLDDDPVCASCSAAARGAPDLLAALCAIVDDRDKFGPDFPIQRASLELALAAIRKATGEGAS